MKYSIDDLQGGGFCEWSYDAPASREEIIAHFNTFRIDEGLEFPKRALCLRFISNVWEVKFNKVKEITL
jgi:hypothetical protein